jgi:uncharacterized protein YjdB
MAAVIVQSDCYADLEESVKSENLQCRTLANGSIEIFSTNASDVDKWYESIKHTGGAKGAERKLLQATTRLIHNKTLQPRTLSPASTGNPWFQMREIASIYNISSSSTTPVTVGVVSFGGGLYGQVAANGVLTGGDVQQYWTSIGIPANSHPRVIVKTINGARNTPNINDSGATIENTIDIETLGGAFASPNLTIILYITPNSLNEFYNLFNYIYTTPVVVNGVSYKPSIISCSWGAPEIYFTPQLLNQISNLLATMAGAGISICTATGDYGSNNGVGGTGNYVDFPSSCPYVVAVGGTTLVCPNNVYDNQTVETAWSSGGGGVSTTFPKPSYQSRLTVSGRATPDICAVADPNTGVLFTINGQYYVIGGTSVSAPIIAGFLASINCRTFANPKLYSEAVASCYHDITSGSNGGYNAETGYDNCSGLGSINGLCLTGSLRSISATSLTVAPTTLSLLTNTSSTLVATVLPVNTSNPTLSWASNNTGVAIVSATGTITTFARAGTATITVATTDGSNLTATCFVTVVIPGVPIPVTGVSVYPTSFISHPNLTTQLVATVQPFNATNKSVTWSSNSSNATVDANGLVRGVRIGVATITVKTDVGNYTARTTVNVTQPVTSIILSNTTLNLRIGQRQQLRATVFPSNAPNKAVVWTSLNLGIATVSSTGLVTAVGNGTINIIATTSDMGLVATCSVTVTTSVQSVSLNASNVSLLINQTFLAVATINPSTASNTGVTWSSSYPNVATVNSSGLITAVGNGVTMIRVRTQDGGKSSFLTVTVTIPLVSATLPSTVRIARGASVRLTPTFFPSNATNKSGNWVTDNGRVATVSGNGAVLGVRTGTATITVRTVDGNFTANSIVNVF